MRKPDFRLPIFPLGEEANAQKIAESISRSCSNNRKPVLSGREIAKIGMLADKSSATVSRSFELSFGPKPAGV
jgi:hypothetical protein